ncbi:DUF1266 domain-containing protein [Eleftheria terrae]|uniref:DUF1266 domain-containing protein n=1 Tax=Eleftheria terrae TaxID=1597781 RepID=UPI00263ABB11|nr:DUF1266 domain-containing protein [Eleftheria terrae]WKB55511.1 DUF1266 domain-containing protein [Eleftheria terrae]
MSWLLAMVVAWWLGRRLRRALAAVRRGALLQPAGHEPSTPAQLQQEAVLSLAHPVVLHRLPTVGLPPSPPADVQTLERQLRPALLHLFKLRMEMSPAQVRAAVAEQLRAGWFRLDLDALRPEDEPRDALAFACARVAFAVQAAAWLGWIDEALWRQVSSQNARRAHDCFDSWQDYGTAWARGRRQWVAGARADSLGVAFDEAQAHAWAQDGTHPWGRLPWSALVMPPAGDA